MFNIITYVINQGVPRNIVVLIVMLPFLATFVAFIRQIIGLKGFGIYTPLVTIFAFLSTGLKYGLITFILVLCVSILGRGLLKKLKLLFLPRMALLLTLLSIVLFGFFWMVSLFETNGFLHISVFPVLILVALGENFVSAQIEKGLRIAIILSAETLLIAIIGFYLTSWTWLQDVFITQPWWLLVTVIVNIALGRWTGLRLLEYIRFREVIKHVEMDKKE